MKTANHSVLVLDGETVKLRLQAERRESGQSVHVDWVRFTALLRNVETPSVDLLWPAPDCAAVYHFGSKSLGGQEFRRLLSELPDCDFGASAQALDLARDVCESLGAGFSVDPELKKGMDFYKFRWSIVLNGQEVAWVGFLSSSDSPRQSRQSQTIHANVMGTACTFASKGWNNRLADLIDSNEAVVTRADLALDFFDGYQGGIEAVRQDYRDGLCNVGGRKLKFNLVGDWENNHDRSIYIGSREAGKVTNIYEKGDQLFGEKAGSEWVRFELRYGNKLRVLSSDLLRRPDDFFAGASDWHQSVMHRANAIASAQKLPCKSRLEIETVQAECSRNLRWLVNTAASSLAVAVQCLDTHTLFEMIGHAKLPGRLKKFSMDQIRDQFKPSFDRIAKFPALVLDAGTSHTFSISPAASVPACA